VPERNGDMLVMSGYLPGGPSLGLKVISVFPDNHRLGLESTLGVVVLLNPATGQPEVIMDGTFLTSIRTGAGSGVATDLLAREDADSVAILGTGGMAWHQLEAVCAVRPIRRVLIWNRTRARAEDFADKVSARRKGLAIEVTDGPEKAVRAAAIVCSSTSSPEPVVRGAWLKPGTHVNLTGAHRPDWREADADVVCAASVRSVDSVSAALTPGDLAMPLRQGLISSESIVPIGAIAAGTREGRKSPDDITLFKSVGLAAQDLAVAKLVRERALGAGLGVEAG
jgi:ornithine cyclodeaminase/alanine dehydrogenase-like protein (mu-crystallin family)